MFAALKRRHWLLQVVLATLLAALLSPTLSRALAHAQGQAAPWSQVCATMAMEPGGGMASPSDAGGLTHLLDHCPLCSLQTDTPSVLPASASALPLLALSDGPPPLFLQAARTPHAWAGAQPRAPPTAS
jgi:Protein of unknown function (DUF2946)